MAGYQKSSQNPALYISKSSDNLGASQVAQWVGILQCRRHKRSGFNPWVRKMTWRRAWQPTPVFLPGESHGQRSLAGYSSWDCKESDTTEVTKHSRTQDINNLETLGGQ